MKISEFNWSNDENNFSTKMATFKDNKLVEMTDIRDHYIDLDNNASPASGKFTELPIEYSLSQNYPNPFNPSTVIRYSLIGNDMTSLKVYDITGKEVANLVNETQDPGRYEVTFNGSNFASGVYFYKITAGSFSSVKRMFLVK